jgi:hypothetical protein
MSSDPKYVLLPGEIPSATDRDVHYITSLKLINLYKVKSQECVVYEERLLKMQGSTYHRKNRWMLERLIPLAPDYYGAYKVPEGPMDADTLSMWDARCQRADAALTHAEEWKRLCMKEEERVAAEKAAKEKMAAPPPANPVWPFPTVYGKTPD